VKTDCYCEQCGRAIVSKTPPGRVRRFCSNACYYLYAKASGWVYAKIRKLSPEKFIWSDEMRRDRAIQTHKRWIDASPEYKEHILSGLHTPQARRKKAIGNSKAMFKFWSKPQYERLSNIVKANRRIGNSHYGTSIERVVTFALEKKHIKFKRHFIICYKQPVFRCIPDIAFPSLRIAVFLDGNYWHGLPKVVARDIKINATLRKKGWVVLRFSESEINNNLKEVVRGIIKVVKKVKYNKHNVHILSELSGERTITVEKRNKISRIVNV
jgi:very-short-patch-repair endonuclease